MPSYGELFIGVLMLVVTVLTWIVAARSGWVITRLLTAMGSTCLVAALFLDSAHIPFWSSRVPVPLFIIAVCFIGGSIVVRWVYSGPSRPPAGK